MPHLSFQIIAVRLCVTLACMLACSTSGVKDCSMEVGKSEAVTFSCWQIQHQHILFPFYVGITEIAHLQCVTMIIKGSASFTTSAAIMKINHLFSFRVINRQSLWVSVWASLSSPELKTRAFSATPKGVSAIPASLCVEFHTLPSVNDERLNVTACTLFCQI